MATENLGRKVTTSPHFKWSRGFLLEDGSVVMTQEDERTVTVASGLHGITKFPINSPMLTLDLYRNANVGMLADLLDKALKDQEYGFVLDYGNQELIVYDEGPDFNAMFKATWLSATPNSRYYCATPSTALAKAILAFTPV